MLKKIIAIWNGEQFMKGIVEKFGEMISDGDYVFYHAWGVLIGRMVAEEVRQPLHDRDHVINESEREIRRMLLEHLSINPKQDVSGCLAMMSMVKDAERIGDYSKNIFELAMILGPEAKDMKYIGRLSKVQGDIARNLPLLKRAFLEGDDKVASGIMVEYQKIKDECGEILDNLFHEQLSTREAVSTTILVRSLKRINSHMCNIASGIVYPLDKIDFVRVRDGLLE